MNLREIIFIAGLVIAVLGIPLFLRLRENRHLKKRTRETVSPQVRKELEEERQSVARRKELFEEALAQAKRQVKGDESP